MSSFNQVHVIYKRDTLLQFRPISSPFSLFKEMLKILWTDPGVWIKCGFICMKFPFKACIGK